MFATLTWGDVMMTSKTVRSPLINKVFHFHMPISQSVRADESELIDFLNADLQTKPFVRINLWVESSQGFDNIGSGVAKLSQLYSSPLDEKTYTDTVTGKRESIMTRLYSGKLKV